jgi:hypothetical protein
VRNRPVSATGWVCDFRAYIEFGISADSQDENCSPYFEGAPEAGDILEADVIIDLAGLNLVGFEQIVGKLPNKYGLIRKEPLLEREPYHLAGLIKVGTADFIEIDADCIFGDIVATDKNTK